MTIPVISIIIPVKNGIATIQQCLEGIYSQTLIDQAEVIVIDSGSTDGTLAILKEYPVRLYQIPPQDFNHGETRNYGVALAKGQFVVMTVQDAIPTETIWLERYVKLFKEEAIQAIVGIQCVAHDIDKNPSLWFKRYTQPKVEIRQIKPEAFLKLSAKEKYQLCNWDNVNAAYRRMALIEIPFEKTNYSEDWLWAKAAIQSGLTLARDPSIMVYHYHHHTFNYNLKVKLIGKYIEIKGFSYTPRISFPIMNLLSQINRIWKNKFLTVKMKIYWTNHNLLIFLSTILASIVIKTAVILSGGKEPEKLYKLIFKNNIPQGLSNEKK